LDVSTRFGWRASSHSIHIGVPFENSSVSAPRRRSPVLRCRMGFIHGFFLIRGGRRELECWKNRPRTLQRMPEPWREACTQVLLSRNGCQNFIEGLPLAVWMWHIPPQISRTIGGHPTLRGYRQGSVLAFRVCCSQRRGQSAWSPWAEFPDATDADAAGNGLLRAVGRIDSPSHF
jgi:hypothetical protein